SSGPNNNGSISILDTHTAYLSRLNTSPHPGAAGYPLAWSPDGRYLAFESYLDEKHKMIYIWDGKAIINITPNDLAETVEFYDEGSWSVDDHFAFNVWFDNGQSRGDPSEIYLWDGKSTTSLSQNPTGRDERPTWNTDGRFA